MQNPKDLIEQNRNAYNAIAIPFSDTRKQLWNDLKPLVKYTKNSNKVLDLGCGNGRLYQLFCDLSIEYVGVDFSEGQLEMARKNYPEVKFVLGEMTDLPFKDNEFDIIYCIATFHHLSHRESRLKALEEMKRVLKPEGKVVMTNWNLLQGVAKKYLDSGKWRRIDKKDFIIPWRDSDGGVLGERYYHAFDMEELKGLFSEAGFKVEENYCSRKGAWSEGKKGGNVVSVVGC